MKKIIQLSIISATVLLGFGACAQIKEQRNLESFSTISVDGDFDIILKKGTKEGVLIESKLSSHEFIKTEISNGKLRLYTKGNGKRWSSSNNDLKVTITFQKLDEIKNSGSSDILCEDDITTKNFVSQIAGSGNIVIKSITSNTVKASIAGSGNLDLKNINATSLKASIAGSGDIKLSGKAANTEVAVAGSGDVHAFELKSDTCDVSIAGSGDIKVNVTTYFSNIRISGSGDVAYKGDAKIGKLSIVGSGDIRKVD